MSPSRPKLELLDVAGMANTEAPPVPWLIEGLAARGHLTMIAGREGIGKSMLSLALAGAVTRGESIAGFDCAQGSVLIVDAENGCRTIHRRVRQLDIQPQGLAIALAHRFHLAHDLGELEAIVSRSEPALVILDSFLSLWPGGKENESGEVASVLDPLRDLAHRTDAAIVLLHHAGKNPESVYRGSSAIGASIELGFTLSRAAEGSHSKHLTCHKCRIDVEPDPRWLRIHVENGQPFVEAAAPPDGESTAPTQPAQAELLPAFLDAAAEPIKFADLARKLGRKPQDGTLRRLRDRALDSGELRQLEGGLLVRVPSAKPPIGDGTLAPLVQAGKSPVGDGTLAPLPHAVELVDLNGGARSDSEVRPTLEDALLDAADAEAIRASVSGEWVEAG